MTVEDVSEVISHAVVTSLIHIPMLLANQTIHIARKALMTSGDQAVMGSSACLSIFRKSFINMSMSERATVLRDLREQGSGVFWINGSTNRGWGGD
ncbi:hypothetical protein D9M68_773390 [compost metagenome]